MANPLIIADQNIPYASEAFAQFGEVATLAGRGLRASELEQAVALVVRSVTRVDANLLEGTAVKFVGTATIGTDHIDMAYLQQRGIRFASAAGCNARSVVEYVLTAIGEYCVARGISWQDRTLGIVGHGNIGSRLAARARGLGMRVLVNDPLKEREEELDSVPLEDLLRHSDFVTLHVPYTREGEHATHHLIGGEQLVAMRDGALLINSSRGAVLDNNAALDARHLDLVLDVFEGEPHPHRALVRQCFLATPHIAGYSFQGKVNGTRMMAQELARYFGRPCNWEPSIPAPPEPTIALPAADAAPMEVLLAAMRHSYPIRQDDADLRAGLGLDDAAWGQHFDSLRKGYRTRYEFASYRVAQPPTDPDLLRQLRQLHLL